MGLGSMLKGALGGAAKALTGGGGALAGAVSGATGGGSASSGSPKAGGIMEVSKNRLLAKAPASEGDVAAGASPVTKDVMGKQLASAKGPSSGRAMRGGRR